MRYVLFLALAGCVIALGVVYYPGVSGHDGVGGGPVMLAGAPAASFPVRRFDGRPDSLASYHGRVVVANLWATWCPACRTETADLERLSREHRADVAVLGIDEGESPEAVASYARSHRLTYPMLVDDQQLYGRAYAAAGLPTTIIIGRDGKVVRGIDGQMTLAEFRSVLAPVLAVPQR
jgi:thiol-disulfide isomerase/thioredoxin